MTELLLGILAILLAILVVLWFGLWRQAHETRRERSDRGEGLSPDVDRLESERALQAEILDHVAEGVVLFDEVLVPVVANIAARRMLGVRGGPLPPRLSSEGVLSVARRATVEGTSTQEVVSIWPGRRRLRVRALPRTDQGGAIVVMQDVTEELRTQQVRQQFVANASHELKSPVAGLEALAEAIGQAVKDDPPAATRFAGRLIAEAERLGRLVDDLLDLSRLEDPVSISTTPVDLSNLTRQMLEVSRPAARSKLMNVTAQIASNVWVRGDEQQLGLMLRNLLDNAIRYTPERGSVWVDVFREGDDIVLRVADNGIGIPLAAQARVFERFFRVNKDRSRETGGTGLGLSIVKHIADLHGGHVGVQSELGEGSVFTVRLPVLAPSGDGAPTARSNSVAADR
jgi:signal transduction histidine kinase